MHLEIQRPVTELQPSQQMIDQAQQLIIKAMQEYMEEATQRVAEMPASERTIMSISEISEAHATVIVSKR